MRCSLLLCEGGAELEAGLGGWLVLESFITPSMFQGIDPSESLSTLLFQEAGLEREADQCYAGIVDEWTFGQYQTKVVAQAGAFPKSPARRSPFVDLSIPSALTRHWSTWITEADFATIAAAGVLSSSRKLTLC